MAKIKSNAHLYVSTVGVADPVAVALTSVTKANPVVVTPATAPTAVAGDWVSFAGTGEPQLDGMSYRVASVTGTTLTLANCDGTKFLAAIASKGTMQTWPLAGAGTTNVLLSACMAQITVTGQAPDTINLDDMCGMMELLGDAKPPTFSFSGFVDAASIGFENLVRASLTVPKPVVQVLIDYGTSGGYIMGPAQIGEITITAGVNAGLQFSGTGVFTQVPTYSWNLTT
jgi:hypothetical protein